MSAVNTDLPLEALQLIRAFDDVIVMPGGTTFSSVSELHAFLNALERRPLSPVESDEAALDATLATRNRCTTREANRRANADFRRTTDTRLST